MVDRLSDGIVFTVEAPVATGTTAIDSTPLDMAGYAGVIWIVRLGTAAANNNIRAQQDVDAAMGAAADLTGTLVASGANNVVVLEITLPIERYFRLRVTRGTTTTIDSLIAIRYGARQRPTTLPPGVSFETWQYVPEGTA
jgi:hypothetical protein